MRLITFPQFYNFPSIFTYNISFRPCNKPLRQEGQKSNIQLMKKLRLWVLFCFFPVMCLLLVESLWWVFQMNLKNSQLSESKDSTCQLHRLFLFPLCLWFSFRKEDLGARWHPILISPNSAYFCQIGWEIQIFLPLEAQVKQPITE